MATCGEVLVKLLEGYGVKMVFGIPGVHTVELYRGLAASSIRHITPRHEQGAGFMADGHARVTGQPGVCFIITGPGMTNIATAMAQAYGDSIPMLVISSVNARHQLAGGNGNLHELPSQREVIAGFTAFSHTLMTPDELPQVLARAFAIFESARPRPVHIEIPLDVITAPAGRLALGRVSVSPPAATVEAIRQAASSLHAARRPLILAGGGSVKAGAALQAVADALQAPLALTINAKGLVPPTHPLLLGSTQSTEATRALVLEADVVLAVGTELGETDYDTVFDGGFKIQGELIRIDIDTQQLVRNYPPSQAIVSDARVALHALAQALASLPEPARSADWGASRVAEVHAALHAHQDEATRAQHQLLEHVVKTLPDVVFVGDSTQPVYVGNLTFNPSTPRSWFNSSTGYGTLGYALPAAIGASLAQPQRPVVCLIGDGGLQFTLPELASAVEAQVPVIVVLWNNVGYGEIKKYMTNRDITPVGVDIFTPDFIALARGFGCVGVRVTSIQELTSQLDLAVARKVPTVLEVMEGHWMALVAGLVEEVVC
jgi:acetolactate synthase-1/2/3 large subunit